MVPLPLFKLAALFVRHVSKYGANHIKAQAHEHPRFRAFAARYGQSIHQLNMRANVALLRNPLAEIKAREKAEAPTVQTKEEWEKEEEEKKKKKAKEAEKEKEREKERESNHEDSRDGKHGRARHGRFRVFSSQSVWRRKFRSLPEAKAVDLFADVVGDTFILGVAGGLIIYESWKALQKPDHNLERIKDLDARFEELQKREEALEKEEEELLTKVTAVEEALRMLKNPQTKKPVLPPPEPAAT